MVEIPKTNEGKKLLCLSMPIDKILQQMFFNFTDVIIEKQLPADIFAYRKGRDIRACVASIYSKLNRSKYLEDISLASFEIDDCFNNISHDKILQHYPFPKKFQ